MTQLDCASSVEMFEFRHPNNLSARVFFLTVGVIIALTERYTLKQVLPPYGPWSAVQEFRAQSHTHAYDRNQKRS
jgi:hypothetical protein